MKKNKPNTLRLNKFIADSGLTSRRKADELIEKGQVKVNGRTVIELGTRVDEKQDQVRVKGKLITQPIQKSYFIFNKPKNVVSTLSDPEGRPTVADYFKNQKERLFPVGRLDWDSEGLLLMTNDGDFANEVSHPKKKIPKTYIVKIDGKITASQIFKLKKGVSIIGGKAQALHVEAIHRNTGKYDWVKIVITEGRNRQVRKMFEKIGFDVKKLQRVSVGQLRIGTLRKGEFKALNANQLDRIFRPFKNLSEKKISSIKKISRRTKDTNKKKNSHSLPKKR